MDLDQLPQWARELLATARVGHLGLIDEADRPRVLPVTFALAEGALWSAVDDKPKRAPGKELARVRWLRRRPQAALCADLYDDDWSRLAWVQALCEAEILEVPEAPAAMSALVEKYPQYHERRPAGPLLRLSPRRVLTWRAAD